MEYLINLGLGIGGSLIAAEIVIHHKRWCQRIIAMAAARIEDASVRDVRLEEWLAALDEHAGIVSSFAHAVGCFLGAPKVAAEARPVVKLVSKKKYSIYRLNAERDTRKLWEILKAQLADLVRLSTREAIREMRKLFEDSNFGSKAAAVIGLSLVAAFARYFF